MGVYYSCHLVDDWDYAPTKFMSMIGVKPRLGFCPKKNLLRFPPGHSDRSQAKAKFLSLEKFIKIST